MYSLRRALIGLCRYQKIISATEPNGLTHRSALLIRDFASDKNDWSRRSRDGDELQDNENDVQDTFHRQGYSRRHSYENKPSYNRLSTQHSDENRRSYYDRPRFQRFSDSGSYESNRHFDGGSYYQSNKRFDVGRLGADLKDKTWDTGALSPIEKNFYVENTENRLSQSEVEAFYKSHNITVLRGQRPLPICDFLDANFSEEINTQLKINNWIKPTTIQSVGWPLVLSGKNMVGIAQTGSGKTLTFVLPGLVHIKHQRQVRRGEGPVVLVLAPTRELAQQIDSVAKEYGKLQGIHSCCVFGGQSKLVQQKSLLNGPEIVVATPGRLLDFLEAGTVNLDRTSYVVLDEADRMLDMGFEPQIRKILGQIRPDRQMLMWSATWPREIQNLAHDFLGDFVQVNIGSEELVANPNIRQIVKVCEPDEKFNLLVDELQKVEKERSKTLIFTQTKSEADFLTRRLRMKRFSALTIHGGKSQTARDETLERFRSGNANILVATDVASRGLDINDITLVVNYDYPNTADDYIHRIGRTARASKTGTSLSFITYQDSGKVDDLIKVLKMAGQNVPEELLQLKPSPRRPSQPSNGYRKPFRSGFERRNSWS
ncbi:uncharacterized protein LOC131930332 [Physella acuta]|uniref:uncharacterized protein LOC131930332 n=1 Tax=Physella acuta TaxID=109671 RepID=UPI0027DCE126|nr:uncharacterized protein LOC131930332 [Physella acuta]